MYINPIAMMAEDWAVRQFGVVGAHAVQIQEQKSEDTEDSLRYIVHIQLPNQPDHMLVNVRLVGREFHLQLYQETEQG